MEEIKAGMYAKAKAGHDKGALYIVKSIEGEYVFLMDGKYKTLEKPKKKNIKHIQPIFKISEVLLEKIEQEKKITDVDVKRAIKLEEEHVKSRCN